MRDNMAMQTITAYKYKILTAKGEPLVSGDGENGTVSIGSLLEEFAVFMKKPRISTYSHKVLSLEKTKDTNSNVAEQCFHFKATSGRYGQRTIAIDIDNFKKKTELGTSDAICHFYNVFFYIEYNTTDNICIFHRYGRGGCKTVFFEIFSRFLKEKGLKIEMTALVSPEQESVLKSSKKTKLRLIKNTTKNIVSPDIADNFTPQKKMNNNVEMELTINLKNRKMSGKIDSMTDLIMGRKKVSEVFEIPDSFEYDQTKVELLVGKQQKTIDLDYLGSMLCECDITDRLKFDEENEPIYETLSSEANSYYLVQKKKVLI